MSDNQAPTKTEDKWETKPLPKGEWKPLILDRSVLNLDLEELAFFKTTTRIQDEDELKEHIFRVQEDAYKVADYPCIRNFEFTKLKISRVPGYAKMMALLKRRADAVFLDIGCCFGNDARKPVVDGWPVEQVICSDLHAPFWNCGLALFRDKETFKAPFLVGDAFNPAFLSPTLAEKSSPRANLNEVKTLTELQGEISVIHASFFFHLFEEKPQEDLAHRLANLMVKQPGSLLFGQQGGLHVPGFLPGAKVWGHSPESWTELWEKVLGKGKCEVKAEIRPWPAAKGDHRGDRTLLVWSVELL